MIKFNKLLCITLCTLSSAAFCNPSFTVNVCDNSAMGGQKHIKLIPSEPHLLSTKAPGQAIQCNKSVSTTGNCTTYQCYNVNNNGVNKFSYDLLPYSMTIVADGQAHTLNSTTSSKVQFMAPYDPYFNYYGVYQGPLSITVQPGDDGNVIFYANY